MSDIEPTHIAESVRGEPEVEGVHSPDLDREGECECPACEALATAIRRNSREQWERDRKNRGGYA